MGAVSTPRGKAPNHGEIGAGLTEGEQQGWVLAK